MSDRIVLIAGGGPVGLFCALILGRRGVRVRLFDTNDKLQLDPRAATTHPATLEILANEGLVEDMRRSGLTEPIFQFWDRPTGHLVAQFDHGLLDDETAFPYVVQCEQFKTTAIILDRLKALPNVEVNFSHEVVGVSQGADSVSIVVRSCGAEHAVSGAYLIGADGGRSFVRKSAGIAFDGFTYPERFLVSPLHSTSKRTVATVHAATSPMRTNGAIASRSPVMVLQVCGGRSFRRIRPPRSTSL